MSTNILITGANRGIGRGLLSRFLSLPNHTVVAAVRSPEHETVTTLSALPVAEGSKLIVVKLDISIWQDAFDAVKTLEAQGIDHIDVAIANAVHLTSMPTVNDVKLADLKSHMEINAFSIVSLYQATRPLLEKSKRSPEPVFVVMGTVSGTHGSYLSPNASYGASKAAAHWLGLQINGENPWLNSLAISPGWVETAGGMFGAQQVGLDEATRKAYMITVDTSCDGIMKLLGNTSKAEHGGKFVEYTGKILPW